MSLVSGSTVPYIAPDQLLVDQIVYELKSQGIFDSFRKECIADVDTKPAYQNLRQRVEGSVSSFLKEQKWNPESNKNQLRELLRKNIYESGFLETGVERIVNQVVNPKINTVFLTKVKEVFYKHIGLQTPVATEVKEEETSSNAVKAETPTPSDVVPNLPPTDLEAISLETNETALEDSNSMAIDDDDTSPPFEPLDEDLAFKLIPMEENSIDSHLSGISGLASHDSQHSAKENTVVMQQLLESDSQLSKNSSSDDRLSIVTDEASNTKVDVNDAVVAMETSDDNEDKLEIINETTQESKDKGTIDDLSMGEKAIIADEVTTDEVKIKEEVLEEEAVPSSSTFNQDNNSTIKHVDNNSTVKQDDDNSTLKQDNNSTSKHNSSHRKDSSRDHKKESSRHYSSSKSRDKSRDSKDYRDSKDKSSKSKSTSSTSKDKDSKTKSSSSSNRHSSDKDKERISTTKKYSSSSSKDKERSSSTSTTKDKSNSSSSKDKDSSSSTSKDKHSSKSSTYKSSSKDHGKTKSTDKSYHRSSSSRKYSTSDTSKSQTSTSSTNKDKRDKKDNSTKDDHFSSKTPRIERRSTDRDSNDGQTNSKAGSTSNNSTTILPTSEEQTNNNTTEDSSSNNSNSKDGSGSNSDCCQNGTKTVPNNESVENQLQTGVIPDSILIETDSTAPALIKSTSPEVVETLDAIKSHLAEYISSDDPKEVLPIIKLPKFASNFREVRKIMKLRKQLKQQSKLRKLLLKENSTVTDSTQQGTANEGEIGDLENKNKGNANYNTSENSLVVLVKDLNDSTAISTTDSVDTDSTVTEETKINDDCLYLDKVSDKTTRYLSYTSSFIDKLTKDISKTQNKVLVAKRRGQKRKISAISSDSSVCNDITADQVSNTPSSPIIDSNSTATATPATTTSSSGGDAAAVTSATAHVHVVKQRRITNIKATQRYNSDDLYKPRPFLKGTTKRTSGRVAN